MPTLHYLATNNRLTKTITPTETKNYPNAYRFTSHTHELPHPSTVDCIQQFYRTLTQHADQGHALLKGQLLRPLFDEPRAKTTRPDDPTQWLWLDIDGLKGVDSVDTFIAKVLPPEFIDVDHIIHYSASSGIKPGLRAHVMFLLAQALPPAIIKEWLIGLNLTHDTLLKDVRLAASTVALLYPLDVTTCQNDKLLYICPPALRDIPDPYAGKQRIELCIRSQRTVDLDLSTVHPAVNDQRTVDVVNELRAKLKLDKVKLKTRTYKNTEYAVDPGRARVTGTQDDGYYTRINLNHGDSYAYWHYSKKPFYLYNFKGEPTYRLQDIVPEYWEQINDTTGLLNTAEGDDPTPIVFRDFTTDNYYNGIYYPAEQRLDIATVASKDRMADFLSQYGLPMPDPIEDWAYRFDPTTDVLIDRERRFANRYIPSSYMRTAKRTSNVNLCGTCPHIDKLLTSVTGDPKSKAYFLNWLAWIYQKRERPGTAWVFHGVQGTGKGLLFHNILAPTLGPDYCRIITVDNFDDNFNEWMETCLLLFIDEVRIDTRTRHLLNKIKSLITEPTGRIRAMRTNPRQVPFYFGMIFASNELDAMSIDATDRRFFVADRQENRLVVDADFLQGITKELQDFVNIMLSIDVVEMNVRTVYQSAAKQQMRLAGQNSNEQFFEMLNEGQLDHFLLLAADDPPFTQEAEYQLCRKVLDQWLTAAQRGQPSVIKSDDLRHVYSYLQGGHKGDISPSRFGRMCTHNNVHMVAVRDGEDTVRGITVSFCVSEEAVLIYRSRRKVVPLRPVQTGLPQ